MAKRVRAAEIDVARPVVLSLQAQNWDVYQEVPALGCTADIVAVRENVVMVVESKTSMTLSLIGQAKGWVDKAHIIYVAVPHRASDSASEGAKWVCSLTGIGLIYVSKSGTVSSIVGARVNESANPKKILEALNPRQKDGSIPAGTSSGQTWSRWRVTVAELAELVQKNPGLSLKVALSKIKTHYSSIYSAFQALSKQALRGEIPGIRAEAREHDVMLYPKPM